MIAEPYSGREGALLQAAVDVLMEKGLFAATTRMVTQRAGVSIGLLNHYFRWPQLRALAWTAIFDAVAQEQFGPDRNPANAMRYFLASAFVPEARQYWQLWLEALELSRDDVLLREALKGAESHMQAALTDVLSKGCREKNWHLPDPQATALRLNALHDGLVAQILSGLDRISTADAERHLRHAFLLECQGSFEPF